MKQLKTTKKTKALIGCFFLSLLVPTLNAQVIASLEAEDGQLTAPAKVKEVAGYSGDKYVGDNDPGSSILFADVEIPEEGTYEFKTYYTCVGNRSIAIKANNFSEVISTVVTSTGDWNTPPTATMTTYIYLDKGKNTIKITPHPYGQGGPNMDKFEILETDYELPKPGEFPIVLEAENARLFGDLKVKPIDGSTKPGLSGGKYIGDFNQRSNSYLQFLDIEVPEEGTYELKVFSMGSGRRLSIKVNQYKKTFITTIDSPSWDDAPASTTSTLIYLDKGKNKITFGSHNDDGPNLDKFEIHQTSQTLSKPDVEKIVYISDHTDEAEITAQDNNETLPYLTDNNEYTIYKVIGSNTAQLTAKCKQPILLTGYLLSSGITGTADVTQWTLELSKDGNAWTTIQPNKSTDLSGAYLFEVNRNYIDAAENSAQYYRLTAKGDTDVEIAEWQLFGAPYLENADGNSFPVDITNGLDIQSKATAYPEGASGADWSEEFYNLFNRQLNNKYYMHEAKQYYVEIELDKPYALQSYTLTSADEFPDRDPKKWTLSGYNEEIGWIELDRQTEFAFPCRYATMRFDIDSKAGFTKFLLDVEDNNGSADSQLLKWQLQGEEYTGSSITNYNDSDIIVWTEQGKINIQGKDEQVLSYQVVDTSGILISRGTLSDTRKEITASRGMYLVTISGNNKNQTIKTVVQ